jgi:hypothetical protein
MYRPDGPVELRPGPVEFVQGLAAAAATGLHGPCRAASAIVGHADLKLGDRAEPVLQALQATSPNRFRGIRHTVKVVTINPTTLWRTECTADWKRRPGRRWRAGSEPGRSGSKGRVGAGRKAGHAVSLTIRLSQRPVPKYRSCLAQEPDPD